MMIWMVHERIGDERENAFCRKKKFWMNHRKNWIVLIKMHCLSPG